MVSKQYDTFVNTDARPRLHEHLLYNASPASHQVSISSSDTKSTQTQPDNRVKHALYWNNRIYLSRHICMAFVTLALIVVPFVLFTLHTVAHTDSVQYVATCVLLAAAVMTLLQTALINPGIITQSYIDDNDTNGSTAQYTYNSSTTQNTSLQPQYCPYCDLVRPPRARHCKHCNVCVARFDHCCLWSGSNIGAGNYKYFLQFLCSLTLLSLCMIAQCAVVLVKQYTQQAHKHKHDKLTELVEHTIEMQPFTFAIALYSTIAFISVTSLLLFHCRLIRQGITTNEFIRRVFVMQFQHPYERGLEYLRQVCCAGSALDNLTLRGAVG